MAQLRLLLFKLLAGRGADAVRSFGRGYDARVSLGHASLIFEHQVADPTRTMGVMDHFWTTAPPRRSRRSTVCTS
jgi:hypothetical protein